MIHVTIYNLSVRLTTNEAKLLDLIDKFLKQNYTLENKGFAAQTDLTQPKVFVSRLKEVPVYYLHTNQFLHFLHFVKQEEYDLSHIERLDQRDVEYDHAEHKVREGWELRAHQIPVREFILTGKFKSKLVSMPTGSGKTATSLISLSDIKYKIGIIVLARFSSKWLMDLAGIYDIETTEVMMVQGAKALKSIITQAKLGIKSNNYFIFNAETMQHYISYFEEDPEGCVDTIGCAPIDLFPLLGIGSLLMDEAHMSFHSLYKTIVHTNAKFHLGLSATFITDDKVVRTAHSVVFPPDSIYDPGELDRYTDVYALGYSIPAGLLSQVKTTNYGSKSYAHTAFEQSVMRSKPVKRFYYSVIDNAMKDYYDQQYEPKDKCLIFVATVKMATELTERYTNLYPDKVVRRYCEEDPFDNLNEGEIIVTTVISAGTAVDIADLRVVVQTVCISSSVSNIQTLGRLRKLKDNKDTRFCYLFADNIPKQKQYHYRRIELFRDRVASHRTFKARASY